MFASVDDGCAPHGGETVPYASPGQWFTTTAPYLKSASARSSATFTAGSFSVFGCTTRDALSVPQSRSLQNTVAAPRNAAGSDSSIVVSLRIGQNGSVVNNFSSRDVESSPKTSAH